MNAIKILEDDHNEFLRLFKLIEKSSITALRTREKLINKVNTLILLHSRCEEKFLYPLALDMSSLTDLTREAFEEHKAVTMLLKRALKTSTDDKDWLAKCTVIRENLEHHIKEEEEKMFPALKKKISSEILNEIGKKIFYFKQKEKTKNYPSGKF